MPVTIYPLGSCCCGVTVPDGPCESYCEVYPEQWITSSIQGIYASNCTGSGSSTDCVDTNRRHVLTLESWPRLPGLPDECVWVERWQDCRFNMMVLRIGRYYTGPIWLDNPELQPFVTTMTLLVITGCNEPCDKMAAGNGFASTMPYGTSINCLGPNLLTWVGGPGETQYCGCCYGWRGQLPFNPRQIWVEPF